MSAINKLKTIMESMDFFMAKIHDLEKDHDEMVKEFRTIASNPLVYPKPLKRKVFERLEKIHKELIALHFKQKSDFRDNQRVINKDLAKYIDPILKESMLEKISDCSDTFQSCIDLKERSMDSIRELNNI
jgi:hypothetical protein